MCSSGNGPEGGGGGGEGKKRHAAHAIAAFLLSTLTFLSALAFFLCPSRFFVALQESVADLARFGKLVKFKAFQPFRSAEVGQCVLGLIAATIY